MYNQWAAAPGRSRNYPRPKSITHLRTFSDNGVYVALQLFLVILVSDQWGRVLLPGINGVYVALQLLQLSNWGIWPVAPGSLLFIIYIL